MKKQGFLKGSAILMSMVVITKGLSMLYRIPLANLLGGSGMAYYSGAFAVFAPVYAICNSGITPGVARLTAESVIAGNFADALRLRRAAGWVFFGLSAAAASLLAVLALPLARALLHSESAALAIVLTAPVLVLSSAVSAERGFTEGTQDMLPTAVSEVAEGLVRTVSGLALAFGTASLLMKEYETSGTVFGQHCFTREQAAQASLPLTAAAAIAGNVLASAAAFIYMKLAAARRLHELSALRTECDRPTRRRRTVLKELLSVTVPISAAAAVSTLGGLIDLMTISRGIAKAAGRGFSVEGISPAQLPDFVYGAYTGTVLMLAGLVPTLTAMLGKSSLPMLTEAYKKRDSTALLRRLEGVFLAGSIIACPAAAVLAVLPGETLGFLFPGRTEEVRLCALPLAVLGAGVIFQATLVPCLSVLQTLGRQRAPLLITGCGLMVKLGLNLLLVPVAQLNITGAAISAAAANAVMLCIALRLTEKASGVRLRLKKIFLPPMFAALLCGAAARTAYDLCAALPARVCYLIAGGTGAAVYVLALYLMQGRALKLSAGTKKQPHHC